MTYLRDLLAYVACRLIGHDRTEWCPSVMVDETYSWEPMGWTYSTNALFETRFCVRCHFEFESRAVLA